MLIFASKNIHIEKIRITVLVPGRGGTNTERSDIDIAVYGGDFDHFYWDVKEKCTFTSDV